MKHWWVAVLISFMLLGGCGQKGPLYLPEDAPAAQQN
ncbi:MAG: lipoprotein [Amphritea sp.]